MKLIISDVSCHRVSAEGEVDGEYLRCAPANVGGPIWYATTASGWELIPSALFDQLEAAFKQEMYSAKGFLQ